VFARAARCAGAAALVHSVGNFSGVQIRRSALALAGFLCRLARYAKGRDRACFQPLDPYLTAALLAAAITAFIDPGDSLFDLAKQFALSIAQAQQKIAIALERGPIRGVSEAVLGPVVHLSDRAIRFAQNLLFSVFQNFAEEFEVSLPHYFSRGAEPSF